MFNTLDELTMAFFESLTGRVSRDYAPPELLAGIDTYSRAKGLKVGDTIQETVGVVENRWFTHTPRQVTKDREATQDDIADLYRKAKEQLQPANEHRTVRIRPEGEVLLLSDYGRIAQVLDLLINVEIAHVHRNAPATIRAIDHLASAIQQTVVTIEGTDMSEPAVDQFQYFKSRIMADAGDTAGAQANFQTRVSERIPQVQKSTFEAIVGGETSTPEERITALYKSYANDSRNPAVINSLLEACRAAIPGSIDSSLGIENYRQEEGYSKEAVAGFERARAMASRNNYLGARNSLDHALTVLRDSRRGKENETTDISKIFEAQLLTAIAESALYNADSMRLVMARTIESHNIAPTVENYELLSKALGMQLESLARQPQRQTYSTLGLPGSLGLSYAQRALPAPRETTGPASGSGGPTGGN